MSGLLKILKSDFSILLLSVGLVSGLEYRENIKTERLREQVASKFGANNSEGYTKENWSQVYKALNMEDSEKEGKDLSFWQLKHYLSGKQS